MSEREPSVDFGHWPDEEKQRGAYIEGREDLFQTKLFHIESSAPSPQEQPPAHIVALTRDPGSGNALVPVLELLARRSDTDLYALTDGRAEETVRRRLPVQELPLDSPLSADRAMPRPDVLVTSASSEKGLEMYAAATFDDRPLVLVEDYYTGSYRYIDALRGRNLRLPEKICVMDETAKAQLVERYPDLAERVVVTGQPAFDRFATEPTADMAAAARAQLHVSKNDKLVTFMSTGGIDFPELPAFANGVAEMKDEFILAFRKHPRDNRPDEEYDKIFQDAGIRTLMPRSCRVTRSAPPPTSSSPVGQPKAFMASTGVSQPSTTSTQNSLICLRG